MLAQIINPVLDSSIRDLSGIEYLQLMLPNFITIVLIVGVVIFMFIMMFGAIQWINSGGDKARLEAARDRITNALIGIVILLATFAILQLIEVFFGINILELDFGPLILS